MGGEPFLWEEQIGFFREDKQVWGEQKGDKNVWDNVCLCRHMWSLHLQSHKISFDRGFMVHLLLVFLLGAGPPQKKEFMTVLTCQKFLVLVR